MSRALLLEHVLTADALYSWMKQALKSAGIVEPFITYFVDGRNDMLAAVKREALRREGT